MGIDNKVIESKKENIQKSNFHKLENNKLKIGIMGASIAAIIKMP